MTTQPNAASIQMRQNTAAGWTAANEVLPEGQWAQETDTEKLKLGDGQTAWVDLAYFPES